MKIQELEQKTGLDRATIRFYEREGLIKPKRRENGYREYSPEDAQLLLKIKLLRQLEFPVERIKALQQGTLDFRKAMEQQTQLLERRAQAMTCAREICRKISAEGEDFSTLDAVSYLEILKAGDNTFREAQQIEFHPVRRYLARLTDWGLNMLLLQWLFYCVIRVRPELKVYSLLLTVACMGLMTLTESVWLYFSGTTPGKWLFGIRVEPVNGGKLSWDDALWRSRLVMQYGMGFYIPIWRLRCLYRSYAYGREGRQLEWEEDTEIQYRPWKAVHMVSAVLVYGMILVCAGAVAMDVQCLPKHHKAQVTIAEFADNLNGYAGNSDPDALVTIEGIPFMDEDGSWHGVHLDMYGNPKNEVEFVCDEEGFIKSVSIEEKIGLLANVSAMLMQTAAGTQPEMGIVDMMTFQLHHPYEMQIREQIRNSETKGEFSMASLMVCWEYAPETKVLRLRIDYP